VTADAVDKLMWVLCYSVLGLHLYTTFALQLTNYRPKPSTSRKTVAMFLLAISLPSS